MLGATKNHHVPAASGAPFPDDFREAIEVADVTGNMTEVAALITGRGLAMARRSAGVSPDFLRVARRFLLKALRRSPSTAVMAANARLPITRLIALDAVEALRLLMGTLYFNIAQNTSRFPLLFDGKAAMREWDNSL